MQAKLPLTKEENALDRAKRMTEEERIDFIREHGTEAMKRGLDSIFNGNKYKPARKEMWESRLKRGELMVACLMMKNNGHEEDLMTLKDYGGN